MKKKRKWEIILGVFMILVIAVVIFFFLRPTKGEAENPIIPQTVQDIMQGSVKQSDTLLTGKVTPKQTEKVVLDYQKGVVSDVLVNEGDQVQAGQALFRYTNADGQLEIKQAELEREHANNVLAQKQEALGRKQTQLGNKQAEYNRSNEEKRETLKSDIEQLKSDILGAESEVEAAQYDLDNTDAKLDTVRQKNGVQEVTSKVTGTVKKINRSLLDKPDSEKNSEPFIEIMDTSEVFVKGMVNEFQKEQIKVDQPVTFVDRTDESKTWPGKIVSVDNLAADNQKEKEDSQTSDENPNLTKFPFQAKFDNAEGTPPNGKHVFVKPTEEEQEGVVLPMEYFINEGDKVYVWKVVKGELKKTEVEVQPIEGKEIQTVTKGLEKEDQIVLPKPDFKNGTKVSTGESLPTPPEGMPSGEPKGENVMEVPIG